MLMFCEDVLCVVGWGFICVRGESQAEGWEGKRSSHPNSAAPDQSKTRNQSYALAASFV